MNNSSGNRPTITSRRELDREIRKWENHDKEDRDRRHRECQERKEQAVKDNWNKNFR